MARIAFVGTPQFAVRPLEALVAAGHEVALVVTREDRRRGRGGSLSPSPVKEAALRLGLPVSHRVADLLGGAPPIELGVVVAYGRLIPASVLATVPMLNLHYSLLPHWRGAAPVERAILAGETVTGVSIMALEETLDTGPIYASAAVGIEPHEHLGPLRERLTEVGTRLLVDLLAGGAEGLPTPRPQEGEPSYAEKIRPEELELHWEQPAVLLERVVRLDGAYSAIHGRRLRVLDAVAVRVDEQPPVPPGTLSGNDVATGSGWLRLIRVQPAGGRAMSIEAFRRGARIEPGTRLGAEREA